MVTKKKKSYGSTVSHTVSNAFSKINKSTLRARVLQLTVWGDSLWHKMLLNQINGIMYSSIPIYMHMVNHIWSHFGHFLVLWIFNQKNNHKHCREPSNDHSYQVWVQFDQ